MNIVYGPDGSIVKKTLTTTDSSLDAKRVNAMIAASANDVASVQMTYAGLASALAALPPKEAAAKSKAADTIMSGVVSLHAASHAAFAAETTEFITNP